MLTYTKLSKKPNSFRSFAGLTLEEFDKLYEFANKNYKEHEKKRLDRDNRIKAVGQGRKFKLCVKERLLMLLIYTGFTRHMS